MVSARKPAGDRSGKQGQHDTTSGEGEGMTDRVKQGAGAVTDKVKETANQVVEQAREKVTSLVDERRTTFADGVSSVAQAIRESGKKLHESNQERLAPYADSFAGRIDALAEYTRKATLGDVMRDASDLARKQPELFLGAAVFAGFALARFVKASGSACEAEMDTDEPQGGPAVLNYDQMELRGESRRPQEHEGAAGMSGEPNGIGMAGSSGAAPIPPNHLGSPLPSAPTSTPTGSPDAMNTGQTGAKPDACPPNLGSKLGGEENL